MTERKPKCVFDPKQYLNQAIGMFHCPLCGEMVIAGLDHGVEDNGNKNKADK